MSGYGSLLEYLSFDDVAVVPGKSLVEPLMVNLDSAFSKSITVRLPFASSPMDTVTGWRLAVALARVGAVGVIHRNMSIDEQVRHVERVKEADSSLESEALIIESSKEVFSVLNSMKSRGINVALVVNQGSVLGFIVSQEVTQEYWISKARGLSLLMSTLHNISPLVDSNGKLVAAAAIGPYDYERAVKLEKAGVNVLVLDVAHAYNENVISSVYRITREVGVDVVVGNVSTYEAVLEYATRVEAVAGFRVGLGSGSICLTPEVTGAYTPTLTAVIEARRALEELGLHGKIPIIADGGVRSPGDAAKAFIAGASIVMSGRLFAGCEEAESLKITIGGRAYKLYRGMASRSAMEKRFASDRYSKPSKLIAEGIEGLVPYTGSVYEVLAELTAGVKVALGYAGAKSIRDAWKARLSRITPLAAREARVHSIILLQDSYTHPS